VTRAAYDASPGIGAQPLFEEVALVRALRRTRRFVAVALPMTVCERRWQRDGLLRARCATARWHWLSYWHRSGDARALVSRIAGRGKRGSERW